jgi:trimethylguanosine synthase
MAKRRGKRRRRRRRHNERQSLNINSDIDREEEKEESFVPNWIRNEETTRETEGEPVQKEMKKAHENLYSNGIEKFYNMRYRLWSKFDEGIQMDETAYYSVTPEKIAIHIAQRICEKKNVLVIDAFSGVGGNAIQFASHHNCIKVIGIEINQERIRMAQHNAIIYGVADKINFIAGDFLEWIHILPFTIRSLLVKHPGLEVVVFLAPPYGGVHATLEEEYNMDEMKPIDACTLVKLCVSYLSPNICFLLPKNITYKQIGEVIEASGTDSAEFEENILSGRCKTVSLYLGNLLVKPEYCKEKLQFNDLFE